MKKALTFCLMIIGMVGIVGLLAWFGGRSGNAEQNALIANPSVLAASEKFYDFGTVSMASGKVSHTYQFKNQSDKPVRIKSVSTSCMCTIANLTINGRTEGPFGMSGMAANSLSQTLNPGDEAKVEAVFDPAAHGPAGVGTISREVIVETDQGSLNFQFSANVIP